MRKPFHLIVGVKLQRNHRCAWQFGDLTFDGPNTIVLKPFATMTVVRMYEKGFISNEPFITVWLDDPPKCVNPAQAIALKHVTDEWFIPD